MIPYSIRIVPDPLFAEAVELELAAADPLAAGAPEDCVPTKSTLRFEIGNCCDVSVRVIPEPLVQTLDVPAAPGVKMTPAHYKSVAFTE